MYGTLWGSHAHWMRVPRWRCIRASTDTRMRMLSVVGAVAAGPDTATCAAPKPYALDAKVGSKGASNVECRCHALDSPRFENHVSMASNEKKAISLHKRVSHSRSVGR
jgi:hypothetical protein